MGTYYGSNDSIRVVTKVIKNTTASSTLLSDKRSCTRSQEWR